MLDNNPIDCTNGTPSQRIGSSHMTRATSPVNDAGAICRIAAKTTARPPGHPEHPEHPGTPARDVRELQPTSCATATDRRSCHLPRYRLTCSATDTSEHVARITRGTTIIHSCTANNSTLARELTLTTFRSPQYVFLGRRACSANTVHGRTCKDSRPRRGLVETRPARRAPAASGRRLPTHGTDPTDEK